MDEQRKEPYQDPVHPAFLALLTGHQRHKHQDATDRLA